MISYYIWEGLFDEFEPPDKIEAAALAAAAAAAPDGPAVLRLRVVN